MAMNGDTRLPEQRKVSSKSQSMSMETVPEHSFNQKIRRLSGRLKPSHKSSVSVSPAMLLLSAVVYGVLVFCMGKAFLPGSPAFATLVIWICSVVGAQIAHYLRIPRVVGMLAVGIILANVPGGVVAAFPAKWGVQIRAAALATIFLRCGLELEFKTMALYKWPALRLAFVPGLAEAIFDAGIATAVFGMPFTLALSLGFILKAVGPGLVVPAMFFLQQQGMGGKKGIPSTVIIAASFDDIIAITGFSIFINVAIATGENAAWQIASGPLQVIFGMLGGVLAGFILGATKFFDSRMKRLIGIYGAALLLMFFLEYFDMLSGGALGSLTVGLVTCYMWEHGKPRRFSLGPNNGYSADIERVASVVWNWVMEPMLFATIGTSIVFASLPSSTVGKSVLVVCTGLCLRIIITYFVMGHKRYNWKEQLFFAVAWTPKATVQASLSAVPLSLITATMAGSPDYQQWVLWGQDILCTGIFAIIICATLGTLCVFWFAPALLEKSEEMATDLFKTSRTRSGHITRTASGQISYFQGPSKQPSVALQTLAGTTYGHTEVDPVTLLQELREANDHNMINEYFDAIEKLVALVMEGHGAQAKDEGLCDTVLRLQEAIAHDVGPRELTVRQMLHSAALRSRQPTINAATADQLVRLSLSTLGDLTDPGGLPQELQGYTPRRNGAPDGNAAFVQALDLEKGVQSERTDNQAAGASAAAEISSGSEMASRDAVITTAGECASAKATGQPVQATSNKAA